MLTRYKLRCYSILEPRAALGKRASSMLPNMERSKPFFSLLWATLAPA